MDNDTRTILGMGVAAFAGVILVILAVGGIVVGGWQAGWWFANQNINRQTHQIHNSYSYQSATQSDLTQKISDINTETVQIDGATGQQLADLKAQRLGEAQLACADASQLTADYLKGEQPWVTQNCSAGVVSLSSPLEK
jgi:hypothetical protein